MLATHTHTLTHSLTLLISTMSSGNVTLLRSSTIVPTTPTRKHCMYLSSLDLYFREFHYNLRVLFYEQVGPAESSQFVATLKQSLEEVLVHFYPLAGRLVKEEPAVDKGGGGGGGGDGGGGGGRYVIDCNDAGVEFLEAQIDASFAELQNTHFDFQPYFADLAPLGELARSDLPHLPLLSVQVTQFMDRGVALAITHNHVAMDGPSLWHFWVSWGECARGLPLSKPPIHARTLFKPESLSQEMAKLLPFDLIPSDGGKSSRPSVSKVIHFTSDAMRKLKELAVQAHSEAEGPRRPASSLEALFAHCWRHVTQARHQLADDEDLHFTVLADHRRHRRRASTLPPIIPENLFGNAITWTMAYATPRILREESFAATVARMARAVDECTHADTLTGFIHWLELHDTRFDFGRMRPRGVGMNAASSPRFPIHLVNYGWGAPTCARPVRVGGDGEICLFPNPCGGLDVCIKLDSAALERLIGNHGFLNP